MIRSFIQTNSTKFSSSSKIVEQQASPTNLRQLDKTAQFTMGMGKPVTEISLSLNDYD